MREFKILIVLLAMIALFVLTAFMQSCTPRQFSSADAKPGDAGWLTHKEATR